MHTNILKIQCKNYTKIRQGNRSNNGIAVIQLARDVKHIIARRDAIVALKRDNSVTLIITMTIRIQLLWQRRALKVGVLSPSARRLVQQTWQTQPLDANDTPSLTTQLKDRSRNTAPMTRTTEKCKIASKA